MRSVQDNLQKRIRTMLIGKVVEFDPSGPTASVQPQVSDIDHAGEEIKAPQLPDVPILYPGGAGWEFSWALQAGDPVVVLCFDRAIDLWWGSGQAGPPNDLRKHDLRDAVVLPLGPWRPGKFGTAHATNLRISGPGGMAFEVTPAGTIEFAEGGAAVGRVGDGVQASASLSVWAAAVEAALSAAMSPINPAQSWATLGLAAANALASISQGSTKVSSG